MKKTMMPSMHLARSLAPLFAGGGEEELCCTTRHECRCDENNKEMAVAARCRATMYPDPLPKQRHGRPRKDVQPGLDKGEYYIFLRVLIGTWAFSDSNGKMIG